MTIKLKDFRLESYEERMALQQALQITLWERPSSPYRGALQALLNRVANTQCQPGGCKYCNDLEEVS